MSEDREEVEEAEEVENEAESDEDYSSVVLREILSKNGIEGDLQEKLVKDVRQAAMEQLQAMEAAFGPPPFPIPGEPDAGGDWVELPRGLAQQILRDHVQNKFPGLQSPPPRVVPVPPPQPRGPTPFVSNSGNFGYAEAPQQRTQFTMGYRAPESTRNMEQILAKVMGHERQKSQFTDAVIGSLRWLADRVERTLCHEPIMTMVPQEEPIPSSKERF